MVNKLYTDIEILDLGDFKFRRGELRVKLPNFIWRRNGSDKIIEMKSTEMEKVTWMETEKWCIQFDFHMKNGVKHQFTRFTPTNQRSLVKLLETQGISPQKEQRVVTGQISASLVEITENSLAFKVNPANKIFEISLADVTDIETMGDDVKLYFHFDDTFGAKERDTMDEMTFSIPQTFSQFFGAKGSSPAIEFKKKLMSMNSVRLGGKDPVATFKRLLFLTPRGSYDVEFNLQFFGLHRGDRAVTLLYRSIVSVHLLPKPDALQELYVVICVDPPLQMGAESLPYLVMKPNMENVENPVKIQMNDQLFASKFSDKLKKSYKGRVYEIFVSILEGLSGKAHCEIGEYGHGVWSADESENGILYPLEDAFYFISNHTKRIFYNDIKNVEITSPEDEKFNMKIALNKEGSHFFSIHVESELDNLVAFMKGKNIEVNLCQATLRKTKGFMNYKKAMKKNMEEQFHGESSEAINTRLEKQWIEEVSDETKFFYSLIG